MENSFKKPFKKLDILVYILLLVIVVLLFLFAGLEKEENVGGCEIYIDNRLIAILNFSEKSVDVEDEYKNVVLVSGDIIEINSSYGYNKIVVDYNNKTVKVTEADCGFSKECKHMDFDRGIIICAPHKLVIKSLIKSDIVIIK